MRRKARQDGPEPTMGNGWIKTHRQKLDWAFFRKPFTAHFFEYCTLKATHSQRSVAIGGQEVRLQPGQFVFGRHVAAEETGLTERGVRTALASLCGAGTLKVTTLSTKQASIITVCNWKSYQSLQDETDQPFDQPPTNHRPTTDQPPTTDKNVKNAEEGKEGEEKTAASRRRDKHAGDVAIPPELDTQAFRAKWAEWEKHRKETRHPLTPTTAGRQLAKLEEVGEAAAIAMIDQSITMGWQGIFEVKNGQARGREADRRWGGEFGTGRQGVPARPGAATAADLDALPD